MSSFDRMFGRAIVVALLSVLMIGLTLWTISPASAVTDEEYEARIAELETRIERLEVLVVRLAPPAPDATAGQANASATAPAGAPPAPNSAPPPTTTVQDSAEAVSVATAEDDAAFQQLYAARDKAVTLSKGKWEAAFELNYVRDDSILQQSFAVGAVASLRYGAGNGYQFGVDVPLDWTRRRTEAGANSIVEDLTAVGDISLTANKSVHNESEDWPGVVIITGLVIPTGVDPYAGSGPTPGRSPSDPFHFYRNAGGHYVVSAGAELFKTIDPFTFFGGFNLNYSIPREVDGVMIEPGIGIGFNLGTTFAVSAETTLGFALNGGFNQSLVTGGERVSGSGTMPLVSTISVLQRIGESYYLEPALTIGLTDDAPDAVFAVTTTKTF
ncbi:MAG TPA: hypothetical protein VFK86_14740 [Bauldia sp.]|nr:hypothetical protein [Bauldia sp.]